MPTLKVPAYFRSSGSIAVAMAVMSVATYGFTMIAARILGTRTFGAFASLMATLLVIGVLQLGLQTTAARRISADPEHVEQIERIILRVTYRASLALGAVLLLLTPVINWVLRLDSLATAAMVGITSIPVTIMGGQAGILQGERRWWPLAVLYVANGVPRLVLGTAMILWRPTEFSAMVGVALGAIAPVLVGAYALRRDRPEGRRSDIHGARAVIKETLHNSQALLAFLALSSVDVIVARNVLPEHEAGLYAGGLIMTKAVLFLPQFVVIVAFPSMSTPRERRRALTRSLAMVAGLGVASTLGAWVLSGLALTFVGGEEYASIEEKLWLFAVLGTVLAMLQLLVYAVLARQGQRSVYFVWMTLIALIIGGLQANSLEALLIWVTLIDAALFAILLGLSLWIVKEPLPEPEKTSV
ncbi:lipopolysaccharide biosynthesis protein [Nocardioides speluncae]|uniref:lipopolysaccharide biosynthesis protein n=1 Tax=Nocardioides speluncae TaxID=2670337 RepID=UPI000D69269D|nr:oligosaccharide flippase family protein [Nocardioides speluncae]